jgi:hypothetical protein
LEEVTKNQDEIKGAGVWKIQPTGKRPPPRTLLNSFLYENRLVELVPSLFNGVFKLGNPQG